MLPNLTGKCTHFLLQVSKEEELDCYRVRKEYTGITLIPEYSDFRSDCHGHSFGKSIQTACGPSLTQPNTRSTPAALHLPSFLTGLNHHLFILLLSNHSPQMYNTSICIP